MRFLLVGACPLARSRENPRTVTIPQYQLDQYRFNAARRPSGMSRGLCYADVLSVSDLFEPPEEGRGVEFPQQIAVLADCTIIITFRNSVLGRFFQSFFFYSQVLWPFNNFLSRICGYRSYHRWILDSDILGRLGTELLKLPAQSLIGSPGTLVPIPLHQAYQTLGHPGERRMQTLQRERETDLITQSYGLMM